MYGWKPLFYFGGMLMMEGTIEENKEEIVFEIVSENFPKTANSDKLLHTIRNSVYINRYTQKKISELIGISETYLTLVFSGKKNLSDKFLEFFGYEKVIIYKKKEGLSKWETLLKNSKK